MTPDVHQTLADSPEYALVGVILRQAYVDLRDTAPPVEQARSIQLFTNEHHSLEMLRSLIDLDDEVIQQTVQRQYPQWFSLPYASCDAPAEAPPLIWHPTADNNQRY
jgi:hypothetical protein